MNKEKLPLIATGFFLVSVIFLTVCYRRQNSSLELVHPFVKNKLLFSQANDQGQKKILQHFPTRPADLNHTDLNITAKSALAVNLNSKQVLFAQNARQTLPIASLSKIMTAVIALETTKPEQKMIVSHHALQDGEASMNLKAGEKLSLEELLYGLMLVSGNDAANVIAENIAGRQQAFVALMNNKAQLLGLHNTRYYNPHGLDEDDRSPNQSTAYELAALTDWALSQYPLIAQIVATKEITFPASPDHQRYQLTNILGLEETFPGMIGVKPGNTWQAGYCLIGLAEQGNQQILTVLLDSSNPKEEVQQLFEYAFGSLKKTADKF